MQSRRNFIGNMATGLAGTLAAPNVLGAHNRVRFGVIGAGARGVELLRDAAACPNTECIGVADIYARRLEEARAIAPAARTHADYRRLLEDPAVDAVLIATPQHLHAEHFIAALDAGKHVYIEKTMAFTVDHAKQMRSAVERAGQRRAGRPSVHFERPRCRRLPLPAARSHGQDNLHSGAHVSQHSQRQTAVGASRLSRHDCREHSLAVVSRRVARAWRSMRNVLSTGAISGTTPAAACTRICATKWPSGTKRWACSIPRAVTMTGGIFCGRTAAKFPTP